MTNHVEMLSCYKRVRVGGGPQKRGSVNARERNWEREIGGGDWSSSNWVRGCVFAWGMCSAVVCAHCAAACGILVPTGLWS